MEAVKKTIWDFRPHLKESTIKQYVSALKKLQKNFLAHDLEFLEYPDSVKEMLTTGEKPLHFTTQRNIYNAIIIYLLALNHDNRYDEQLKVYKARMDELNEKYHQEQESGIISNKQSPNFITKDELESFIKTLKTHIKKDDQTRMVYVMFEILTRVPLRNDLAGMVMITPKRYTKLTDDDKKEHNYLVKDGKGFTIIDNVYKTSKKYGEKKIAVDGSSELAKILRSYLRVMKYQNGSVIFPITTNYMSQLLIKYSKLYAGKSISTTMIRKIIASDKFVDHKEEQEKYAKMMGHTVGTQNKVYVKKRSPKQLG